MKPEDLINSNQYTLIDEVNYKSILGFIISCLRLRSPVINFFYFFLILTTAYLGYNTITILNLPGIHIIRTIGLGIFWLFIIIIPIIPIH